MPVEDAFSAAAQAGIHRLEVPTPFSVGTVNSYLIEDNPLTLIDSGPNSASNLQALEVQLGKLGYRTEDLQLLIITHQHIDHFGLTDIIVRHSGATVAALSPLDTYLADYEFFAERDDLYAEELMLYHGVPDNLVHALRTVARAFRTWATRVDVTKKLHPEAEIALAERTLTTHHRPGHSLTDTIFHDAHRKIAFGGDHLLGHIASNPLITLPIGNREETRSPADHPKALPTYIESLKKTQAMEIDLLLTGHGEPVTDHRALIADRFQRYQRRCEKIHSIITPEPKTVYEIACAIWGNISVTNAYFTLCEVLGHLDLLIADGQAELVKQNPVKFKAQ